MISGVAKNRECHDGIPVAWSGGRSPIVETPSYHGWIQAIFYGFDASRFLNGITPELLLFGNEAVRIPAHVRNDNTDDAWKVQPINSVTREKRLNSFFRATDRRCV